MVGPEGFEPSVFPPQTERDTKLRYRPIILTKMEAEPALQRGASPYEGDELLLLYSAKNYLRRHLSSNTYY